MGFHKTPYDVMRLLTLENTLLHSTLVNPDGQTFVVPKLFYTNKRNEKEKIIYYY
jgi:hypothetical protein